MLNFFLILIYIFYLDPKTKPPSDVLTPSGQITEKIEDEAPWRRANSLRTRSQIDSPPKNSEYCG